MSRAPYQVLVLPFRRTTRGTPEYAVLRRSDDGRWQGVAGGGHRGESPGDAAIREAHEEAALPSSCLYYALQSVASIPRHNFAAHSEWPQDLYVVPEYAFAVDCGRAELALSGEHSEHRWETYDDAHALLHWNSNQVALWELHERIRHDELPQAFGPGSLR